MSEHLSASPVVALVVALVNGLLAGYVLTSSPREPRTRRFSLGPAGVALFALGWFMSFLEPEARPSVRFLAAVAALLSLSGFCADALMDLGPSRRRAALVGSSFAGVAALVGAAFIAARWLDLAFWPLVPEALALGAVWLLGGARLLLWKHESGAVRQLSRHVVALVAAALLVGVLRLGVEMAQGRLPGGALLLSVILVSETVTLSYILHGRVAVQVPASRAVAHALLSLLVVVSVVAVYRLLGYRVDGIQVAVTAVVALVAVLLFLGLGEHLTRALELLLLPTQARLSGQLSASRSEAAALRSRLERVERLAIAGELAASVAHEIKNPLAAVRGYAELLGDYVGHVAAEERPQFERAVRVIRDESDRIDERVTELLRLSRAPRERRRGGTLDVTRLVLETMAVAEGEADFPALVPTLGSAVRALGDEDQVRGALLNLLRNAADAMRGGQGRGRIEVAAWTEAGRAVIEVRDEGVGLGGVDPEQLFKPFYTTKVDGTGLGLAISRSAVEAAGGKLSLAPRPEGKGAVARMELPEAPAPQEEQR